MYHNHSLGCTRIRATAHMYTRLMGCKQDISLFCLLKKECSTQYTKMGGKRNLQLNQRVNRGIKLLGAIQKGKLHNENIFNSDGFRLLDQFTSSTSRTTSSNQIINDDNTGARLNRSFLHFKDVLTEYLPISANKDPLYSPH